jgi:hypothetical protein
VTRVTREAKLAGFVLLLIVIFVGGEGPDWSHGSPAENQCGAGWVVP